MKNWLLLFPVSILCLVYLQCSSPSKNDSGTTAKNKTPAPAVAAPEKGMDLSHVNVCQLITKDDVASVFGPVRDEPKEDPPNGNEKGCTYYNQEGHFVDISLSPLDDWNLILQLNPDAKPISDIGGHHAVSKPGVDSLEVWVHQDGKAVINVRDSLQDADQARKFAEMAVKIVGK